MKIIQLTAENVKKLKVVDITPTNDFIQVTGPNGSGKTSVLDSIWWALGGKEEIQSVPIRKGAEKARIRLDLGTIVVERKFSASGTTITVKNADGASYPSPQAMLDDLIGRLSFDPLAFAKKEPRQQYEELKSIANVEVDIDALESANKVDFSKRTEKNRQAKELRARATGFDFKHDEAPKSLVDVSGLVQKVSEAVQHNADVDRRAERRAEAATVVEEGKRDLTSAEASRASRVKQMEASLESAITLLKKAHAEKIAEGDSLIESERKRISGLEAKLTAAGLLPEKVDVSALQKQVEQAQILNREFERRAEQAEILRQATAVESESDLLTKAIAERDSKKVAALQAANMPVAGLSLASGQVFLDGVPFNQASDAEQLRTSVSIAMAANPKLRVIRIRDGSLLDDNGIALIAELAKTKDYQVWMERVDSSGKIGIVMEDGQVAADNQPAKTLEPKHA